MLQPPTIYGENCQTVENDIPNVMHHHLCLASFRSIYISFVAVSHSAATGFTLRCHRHSFSFLKILSFSHLPRLRDRLSELT